MTIMTKPYHKTELVRLIPKRTTENVMPFKPSMRSAYKASMGVILYYAIPYSHLAPLNMTIIDGNGAGVFASPNFNLPLTNLTSALWYMSS